MPRWDANGSPFTALDQVHDIVPDHERDHDHGGGHDHDHDHDDGHGYASEL
jgi:hypothetical protein